MSHLPTHRLKAQPVTELQGHHPLWVSTGMDGRPIRASKYAANGAKNAGSSNSASTRPNSPGSTNNSDGRIDSHNVGWSFTVLSTTASIPSSPGVEASLSSKHPELRDRHAPTFQVEVASRSCRGDEFGQRFVEIWLAVCPSIFDGNEFSTVAFATLAMRAIVVGIFVSPEQWFTHLSRHAEPRSSSAGGRVTKASVITARSCQNLR